MMGWLRRRQRAWRWLDGAGVARGARVGVQVRHTSFNRRLTEARSAASTARVLPLARSRRPTLLSSTRALWSRVNIPAQWMPRTGRSEVRLLHVMQHVMPRRVEMK